MVVMLSTMRLSSRMTRPALLLSLCALPLGGCSAGDDRSDSPTKREAPRADPKAGEPRAEARAIRAWSAALNRGDFARAASFFAENAVVEQEVELRLPNRAAAIAFNRSLPCRADVTDVERRDSTVVAAFRLRMGRAPGGGCDGGTARVRFRFSGGKFAEWRQLEEPAAPEGRIA